MKKIKKAAASIITIIISIALVSSLSIGVFSTLSSKTKDTAQGEITAITESVESVGQKLRNDEDGELIPPEYLPCKHTVTYLKNYVASTCFEDGYSGDTHCSNCNLLMEAGSIVSATGHVNTEIRDATEGYTGDTYCIACNTQLNTGEYITFEISYNLNSGTQASNAITSYTIETATFSLPTPTRSGYTFGGWYTNSDFSGSKVTQIAKGSTGNKTYYAKWTPTFTSQSFSYVEGVQTFTVPATGLYKLEVYGGGNDDKGYKGSYAVLHTVLTEGQTLYIATGGKGGSKFLEAKKYYDENTYGNYPSSKTAKGGWNGGANSKKISVSGTFQSVASGGGATHIALSLQGDGQLKNYANYKNDVLIVAGGAGGSSNGGAYYGSGTFGAGTTSTNGGGGGWYGNSGGGASYIGVTANTSTSTYEGATYNNFITAGGATSGNGQAIITFIA